MIESSVPGSRVVLVNRFGNVAAAFVVGVIALAATVGLAIGGAYLCWWLIPGWPGVTAAMAIGGSCGILLIVAAHKAWEMWG